MYIRRAIADIGNRHSKRQYPYMAKGIRTIKTTS